MFTLKVDGKQLGIAVNAITAYVQEGWVMFDQPDVMFMKAVDTALVGLAEAKLRCKVEGNPVDFMVKYANIPTDLTGEIEVEISDRMYVTDGKVTYKIDLLVPLPSNKKPPNPNVIWPMVFTMPSSELQKYMRKILAKIDSKDHSQGIMWTWTGTELIIEDSKKELIDVTFEENELQIRTKAEIKVMSIIPADYMREMVGVLGSFETVVIGLGNAMPLSIGCSKEGVGCGWLTSPRIE